MAHCPFCKATIDDELARFGGHCPKCVIEIPGDETPTDPGVGKRVEEQVEAEQQRRWGVFAAVGGLVAVVVIGAGSVLWWRIDNQRQAAELARLEAEADNGFFILPAEEHELPTAEPEEQPEQGKPGNTGRSYQGSTVTNVPANTGTSSGPKRYDFTGGANAEETELAGLQEREIDVGPGGGPQVGSIGLNVPQIDISRSGLDSVALSDPEEIRKSVGTALKAYSQQMNTCYERRLKNTPDLAGTWDVSFTITTSGSTAGIGVVPHTVSDRELETCMSQAIASWKFQNMAKPQNFSKPYTFGTQ